MIPPRHQMASSETSLIAPSVFTMLSFCLDLRPLLQVVVGQQLWTMLGQSVTSVKMRTSCSEIAPCGTPRVSCPSSTYWCCRRCQASREHRVSRFFISTAVVCGVCVFGGVMIVSRSTQYPACRVLGGELCPGVLFYLRVLVLTAVVTKLDVLVVA